MGHLHRLLSDWILPFDAWLSGRLRGRDECIHFCKPVFIDFTLSAPTHELRNACGPVGHVCHKDVWSHRGLKHHSDQTVYIRSQRNSRFSGPTFAHMCDLIMPRAPPTRQRRAPKRPTNMQTLWPAYIKILEHRRKFLLARGQSSILLDMRISEAYVAMNAQSSQ